MMNRSIVLSVVLTAPLLAHFAFASSPKASGQLEGAPSLDILLEPLKAATDDSQIDRVGVTLRIDGVRYSANEPVLRLPLVTSNVDTVATVLDGLTVSDTKGPLHLSSRDVNLPEQNARDSTTGGPSREWLTDRVPQGSVSVHYTVPAQASLPPRGPAPPLSFISDGGGVSAAGEVFVLLPPQDLRYRTTVDWNLARAPKGSRGVTSLGEDRVVANEPLTGGQIRMTFFMAGRIHTWPARAPKSGFFAAWQGAPPFDVDSLMAWTGELYGHYAQFFGQKEPPPYGVFLRYNPVNAGGGVGLYHSFVTTFGKARGSGVPELKTTLAHEMFHTFQPFIQDPVGLASSWFGEGLAVFYESRLPLRYGLISPSDFLRDLNFSAGRYYTSIMASVPNSEVPLRFWADTRIRTLPYDRGMLYFASVDAELRKASGGKRSMDDLMLEMLQIEHSGKTTTNADWEAVLDHALGKTAVEEFRQFLAGKMPIPPSDAFGPCFQRTSKPLRRYEVGFDPAVLAQPKRIVQGLVPGSAAAQAGLLNGDEIVQPVPQDAIQGTQDELLTLTVRRDGKVFPITYLPRGELVNAYQWERKNGVPDSSCAL